MRRKRLIWALALCALILWLLWGNRAIRVSTWTIADDELPGAFDGFRIAQVSDLHNASFWGDAVQALRCAEPDLIVLTGDLIDSGNTDVDLALDFVREAMEIAPCCFVSGNHEAMSGRYEPLRRGLEEAGVEVLEDSSLRLERDGAAITVLGLQDPAFGSDHAAALEHLTTEGAGFQILLSHRPERLKLYARFGVDLVFSGHAHGGQIRIPFVGGLVAPNQGWFPEYDAGLFECGETRMLVSRGVGNSIIPLRINNRPEILVVVLNRA